SEVLATGNYTISGNAGRHILVNFLGLVRTSSRTVTLTSTPAFSTTFVQATHKGLAIVFGNTYSGSATGKRYDVSTLSEIHTNGGGSTYLPGDSSGTADGATFGLYI